MSHELEIGSDGQASMAYVGEVPWHGLGTEVKPDLTPQEMLEAAGLLWTVEKDPAFIYVGGNETEIVIDGVTHRIKVGGEQIRIPRSALRRSTDNKILDTVTPEWNPLQNEEAFEFFADFVAKGDMEMHTAGSLKGGQLVWALAKIKEGFFVGHKKDEVQSHLLFTNPHQFGKAIDIRFTPIRVVCWNTLSMALGRGLTVDQQVVRMSHRRPFDSEKVRQTLGIAHEMLEEYKDAANFIATKRYTDDKLNMFFRDIFPKSGGDPASVSRNHRQALAVIHSQPGADMEAGSWWQAFNTVTYMTDHLMGRSPETRLDSAWFGANRALKSKALNNAVEMAKDSPDLVVA